MERQYVGIDLHRRSSTIYRMAEDGEVLGCTRIPSQPFELAQAMKLAGKAPEVVLESTYGWYWAADLLQEMGAHVHLAHALGNNWGNRRVKNDERDAKDLAAMLRLGRLAEGWIAPPASTPSPSDGFASVDPGSSLVRALIQDDALNSGTKTPADLLARPCPFMNGDRGLAFGVHSVATLMSSATTALTASTSEKAAASSLIEDFPWMWSVTSATARLFSSIDSVETSSIANPRSVATWSR